METPSPENTEEEQTIKQLQRGQWLRAAILGANDGLLSTASLMVGVGAAKEDQRDMILAGVAGALAGACSMAVGEFVSVSTQRDIEKSILYNNHTVQQDIADHNDKQLKLEIVCNTDHHPITPIDTTKCVKQNILTRSPVIMEVISTASLTPARSPVTRVVGTDNILRGLKEEKEKIHELLPNPYKAAAASGLAFMCGSLAPLLTSMVAASNGIRIIAIVVVASIALAVFGGAGAYFGGSPVRKSAGRVVLGGWVSMAITYAMLKSFDKDKKEVFMYLGYCIFLGVLYVFCWWRLGVRQGGNMDYQSRRKGKQRLNK